MMQRDIFNTPEFMERILTKELRRRIHKNIVVQVKQDENNTKNAKVSFVFTKDFALADDENPTHQGIHNMAGKFVKELTELTDQFKRLYSKTDRGFCLMDEELKQMYCSKKNKSVI